jgi:hypothetical protein
MLREIPYPRSIGAPWVVLDIDLHIPLSSDIQKPQPQMLFWLREKGYSGSVKL